MPEAVLCLWGKPDLAGGPVKKTRRHAVRYVEVGPCSFGADAIHLGSPTTREARLVDLTSTWKPVCAGGLVVCVREARPCGRPGETARKDRGKPVHAGGPNVYDETGAGGRACKRTDEGSGGRTDRRTDGRTDGRMDGRTDGRTSERESDAHASWRPITAESLRHLNTPIIADGFFVLHRCASSP